MNVQLSEE